MSHTAKILRVVEGPRRVAEVELVAIKPWGYRITDRTFVTLPVQIDVHEGDMVELKRDQSSYAVARRSGHSTLARLSLVVLVSAFAYFSFQSDKTLLRMLEIMWIPVGWAIVFVGKSYSQQRYIRRNS